MSALYNVEDARSGRYTGPYLKTDAEGMAHDLNHMVARNTFPALYRPDMKVTGPFYVRVDK